jgi:FtsH-binding integral membrane protein
MDLMEPLDQFASYLGKNGRLRSLMWWFAVPFGIVVFMVLFIKSDFFSGLITTVPGLCLLALLIGLYFFPATKAYQEKRTNRQAILVLNVFLGWTLVGWVVALVWAYSKNDASNASVVGGTPPALCSSCGKYSRGDVAFCGHCGKKLS